MNLLKLHTTLLPYLSALFLFINSLAFSISDTGNLYDTTKIISLNNHAKELWQNGDYDSAFVYVNQAKSLSQAINYTKGLGDAYNSIGAIYRLKGDLTNALSNFEEAIKCRERIKDKKGLASSTKNIGSIYESQGNYPQAFTYYYKALQIFESINDTKGIANSHIGLSNIYDYQGKYNEALKHSLIALKLQENNKDQKGIANSHLSIGVIYYNQKNHPQALYHFQKALSVSQEINYTQGVSFCYNNIGNVYKNMQRYTDAIKAYHTSLKIKESMEDIDGVASSYINLGSTYIALKNYKEALNNLNRARDLSVKVGNRDNIKLIYGYNAQIDSALNNYKGAYYNFYNYVAYRDSMINEENSKKSLETQLQYEFDKKETLAKAEQAKKDIIASEEKQKQKLILWFALAGLVLVIIFAVFMFNRFRIISKQKRIIELKEQETQRKNDIISYQKDLVEEKQKKILDSINYAKRIQYTLLAHDGFLKENINEHFIYFNPKDIVSGDFYWATKQANKFYLAVCDSTGHGVPGAFMSLLNIGFLSEAINEKGITKPNEVFDYVRERLTNSISKEGQKDGFDGTLICFDTEMQTITYAAANNSPVLIHNNQLLELGADRMPVGVGERKEKFTLFTINYHKGDMLYLYTDGYADQFGGPKGKKFKYKQLNELLVLNHAKPLTQQQITLQQTFNDWRGDLEQIDDVCVIGIKL